MGKSNKLFIDQGNETSGKAESQSVFSIQQPGKSNYKKKLNAETFPKVSENINNVENSDSGNRII